MRLSDKVAIITGGGSGIGRASAVMFAREGAFVAIVDRDAAGAEETLLLLHSAECDGSVYVGDVGAADFANATIESVAAARGPLDVLMTAAGFSCGGTVVTTDPADWDAVFRANVGGTWLWAKHAVPIMQRQHQGSIITLASQLAIAGGNELGLFSEQVDPKSGFLLGNFPQAFSHTGLINAALALERAGAA